MNYIEQYIESYECEFLKDDGVLIWFQDKVTDSTLCMTSGKQYTREDVRQHITRSRAKFFVTDAERTL